MAQGPLTKKRAAAGPGKSAGPAGKRPSALGPKRHGSRVIAPKKAKLAQQHKLIRKHTAGLTALTEKNLAERAGHLEMLKGGKKDSKGPSSRQKKK
ncbi:hypothetical protein BDY21DRAFT_373928 [Lineolata rhizophorae]|uniref:Uncharacterized protein n=1 Tax=Lineolata rhizophorae TaxID=578093 RepID=A0A6A6NSZ1_9PEZI|nr:hypothetical protein BDY21DRAFT_373928 [Lineolata rhizophorae]